MPIDSLLNANLLRAYGGSTLPEETLDSLERVNEVFWDALQVAYRGPTVPEGRSVEVLRRLTVAADELRRLGAWMASHAFPAIELVGDDTEEDHLYAFREDYGRRFGQHLLALAARFQEGFHPTREEVRAWRDSLPEEVQYWSRGVPLEYPPPVLPPARSHEGLVLSSVARDLEQLREFLAQAARHYSWMVEDLPVPPPDEGEDEGQPLERLARALRGLQERLAEVAGSVDRLAGEVARQQAGGDAEDDGGSTG